MATVTLCKQRTHEYSNPLKMFHKISSDIHVKEQGSSWIKDMPDILKMENDQCFGHSTLQSHENSSETEARQPKGHPATKCHSYHVTRQTVPHSLSMDDSVGQVTACGGEATVPESLVERNRRRHAANDFLLPSSNSFDSSEDVEFPIRRKREVSDGSDDGIVFEAPDEDGMQLSFSEPSDEEQSEDGDENDCDTTVTESSDKSDSETDDNTEGETDESEKEYDDCDGGQIHILDDEEFNAIFKIHCLSPATYIGNYGAHGTAQETCNQSQTHIDYVNQKWSKDMDGTADTPRKNNSKKVHFLEGNMATVYIVIGMYSKDDTLPDWSVVSRDRQRFEDRIKYLEPIISPVLQAQHRKIIQEKVEQWAHSHSEK